jgi:hypothetical protein
MLFARVRARTVKMPVGWRILVGFWAPLLTAGCGGSTIPDPREAARAYAGAVQRGDADAVYGMLTKEAKRDFGPEGTRRLVKESGQELQRQSRAVSSPDAHVDAVAEIRFADGESALLELEGTEFRVGSAATLPSRARTVAQALDALRKALARRSYAAFLGVLTSESKSAIENDLRSLVEGLEQPETLDIHVSGDTAEVQVPGGHVVKLKREAGVWRIEDFD